MSEGTVKISSKTSPPPSKVQKISKVYQVGPERSDMSPTRIHPILLLKDPTHLFGLIERRPPHPTHIERFGLVSIVHKNGVLSNLALVSKEHDQVLYICHNRQKSPLPTIMGHNYAKVIVFDDQFYHYNNDYVNNDLARIASLILLILDQGCSWPNVSPLHIASFLMTLNPLNNKTTTYKEYLRLLELMKQQPAFDVARDTVMIDKKGRVVPRTNSPAFIMANLPPEMLYGEIYKHVLDKNDLRLLCRKAKSCIPKMNKKRISFHAIATNPLSKLVHIVSNTSTVILCLPDSCKIETGDEKSIWKTLRLPVVLKAFSKVDTLVLEFGFGKDFDKFLVGVLLQPDCKLHCIQYHMNGHEGGSGIDKIDMHSYTSPLLTKAIAKNKSVKEYDLCAPQAEPFREGIFPVLAPWVKGLSQCQHVQAFKYDEQFRWPEELDFDCGDTLEIFTPTEDILAILVNNQDSLTQVQLRITQSDAIDRLADKFVKEGKAFTLIPTTEEWSAAKAEVISGTDSDSEMNVDENDDEENDDWSGSQSD